MKKLLLTGASGFLGYNLYKAASQQWLVHGIIHQAQFDFPGITIHRQNLTDSVALKKLFKRIKPDAVIHTAAISDANHCQQHPLESYSINVTTTQLLAKLCAENKIPFVFTSSDLVFDGKKGNYKETDAVNPLSKYGEQKAEAENLTLKIYPEATVCRMPLMIGDGRGKGYLHAFLTKAKNGEPLKLFTDEFRSPLGGISAANGLLYAIQHFKGIYHLGGKERLSRFELGAKITAAFGISTSQLLATKQSELQMAAPRPADVSLNSEKAYQAGFHPLFIEKELQIFCNKQSL